MVSMMCVNYPVPAEPPHRRDGCDGGSPNRRGNLTPRFQAKADYQRDSTVEYHAPMLAIRIKQRPIQFAAWFMSSALPLASLATFITGIGYFGNTKQVMFISGGLLIQDAPLEGTEMGLRTFNVEMPDRGIRSRVRGFFMLPQRIGSALWIPSGSSLLILVMLVSWRYWRDLDPLDGCCEQGG